MANDQPHVSSLTMAVRDVQARLDNDTRQELSAIDLTPIISAVIQRAIEWWQARCPNKPSSEVREALRNHPKHASRIRTFVAEELRQTNPKARRFGQRLAFSEAKDRVTRAILEGVDGSTDDRILEVRAEVLGNEER